MSKIPMFPNKFAILASILGVCINNPSHTFGVYQGWSEGGYNRVASMRKDYPRACLFLSGTFGIAIINIAGNSINNLETAGSKLLYSPNMSQLNLWFAEDEGYLNIYTNITNDIYKLEIYNISVDKSRANIIHTESLPSGAVQKTLG